jgi:membrane associated rhomboid family serine protease
VVVPREDWERRPFRTSFLLACCPCFLGNPCGEDHRRDLAAAARSFIALITGVDIIAFLLEIVVTLATPGASLGFLAPAACILIKCGAVFTPLMVAPHWQLWRLVTPIALHAGPLHIIMNMYVQLLLGIQCGHSHCTDKCGLRGLSQHPSHSTQCLIWWPVSWPILIISRR